MLNLFSGMQIKYVTEVIQGEAIMCKKVILDTNILYEELTKDCGSILEYCDYLIDGPYVRDLPSHCKYAGSGNQRFLRLKNGVIDADLTSSTDDFIECEIIINPDGMVTTTGFCDILDT